MFLIEPMIFYLWYSFHPILSWYNFFFYIIFSLILFFIINYLLGLKKKYYWDGLLFNQWLPFMIPNKSWKWNKFWVSSTIWKGLCQLFEKGPAFGLRINILRSHLFICHLVQSLNYYMLINIHLNLFRTMNPSWMSSRGYTWHEATISVHVTMSSFCCIFVLIYSTFFLLKS